MLGRAFSWLVLLATLPLAAATTWVAYPSPTSFERDGTLMHADTGYAKTGADAFQVLLTAGASVTATLTWPNAATDLDVLIVPPDCAIAQDGAPCVLRYVVATCPPEKDPFFTFTPPDTVTFVAPKDGIYSVLVQEGFAPYSVAPRIVTGTQTSYHVSLRETTGAGFQLDTDSFRSTVYTHSGDLACRV